MLKWNLIMISLALLIPSGCSNRDASTKGVIPEAQLKALEKAQSVDDELKKQHEELLKKLDQE